MKDKLLELLNSSDKALSIYEIDLALNLDDRGFRELQKLLEQLTDDFTLYNSNKNKYMLLEKSHLQKGTFRANTKGFGFVQVNGQEEDYYIDIDHKNGALHGDIVLIEPVKNKKDKPEAKILRVLKRELETIVGEVIKERNDIYITPDDKKLNIRLKIKKNLTKGAVPGHKVVAKIGKKLNQNLYAGTVESILGHKNDPGVDILSIIYKYNIDMIFEPEVLAELEQTPDQVSPSEVINRKDLRDENIFTIDGDDTKDIDDALSIKKLVNGNYEVGVHIADVAYYVRENTELDLEAKGRGTSIYLVDRVIPMLPHKLSNGICSLNENVDRLAVSCIMQINPQGRVVDYELAESVINSKKQMTYYHVNNLLVNDVIHPGYEGYVSDIKLLKEVSDILRAMKVKRGYLDFDVDEAKILVNDEGVPTDIVLRDRGVGEMIIEDLMIAANECVATHINHLDLPFLYRIHEYPEEEKIRSYVGFLGSLGHTFTGDLKKINPLSIQKLLNYVNDQEEAQILSRLLLRNMRKAVYSPNNLGHFGLGSTCYGHFTAPIRRYPDLTVHRLLKEYVFNYQVSKQTVNRWSNDLLAIGEQTSSQERTAIDCEREVESMKMAEYMEKHIGEEFNGIISSVTNFGMFIELDNLVEGLVRLADLDDFYNYNENLLTLTGERRKKKYTIGDKVKVKVVRASKEEKTIDFEIIK